MPLTKKPLWKNLQRDYRVVTIIIISYYAKLN